MNGRAGAIDTSGAGPALRHAQLTKHLAALVVVGALYYLGARLGLSLSLVERNVTPLWPPTGIAVAAFLLAGRSMWPAVALAALAVNLPISTGPLSAAATAVGNTVAPLVAASLLQRVRFRRQLDRRRDALAIVFLGALASMLISATIGAGSLVASGAISGDDFLSAWAVWWTGDAMGVLVVAPFVLSLPLFWERKDWRWPDWVEEGAVLVLVAAVTVCAALSDLGVLFLSLPVLGWAAWRLQLRGAAPAALIASLVVTAAAAREQGPFDRGSLLEQMLTLQAFNACVALTSFFLAALVSERLRAADALEAAAIELEERVRRRTTELSSANARLVHEIRERSEAEERLSREEERAQKEHQIAVILQRSMLPDRLPDIPGVALAARYVPATADVEVGGDWYDVMQLPDGLIGLAVGDVAGHGLRAATTMGQLRMALRAYALQDPSPVAVMRGVHNLMMQFPMPDMATVIYLLFDPATGRVRFTNAGHPPALVVTDASSGYLPDGLAPPVGVTPDDQFDEVSHQLAPGATLLLYTDGLVERRGVSITDGLDRLRREAAGHAGSDLDDMCDRLLSALVVDGQLSDDIALVAMRSLAPAHGPLRLSLPAEPRTLAQMRRTLRRWLREAGVAPNDENEIVVACGEACANVVQHAYAAAPGVVELEATRVGDSIEVSVRDQGGWRPAADRGGGWGLSLIEALMDSVDVQRAPDGTEVRMRRRVGMGALHE
jgi:serine phosphatase RsbU (regulator of sigma subunit)/anti-sigma regulatory factor (Ser/Thr protein kinase)